GCEGEGGLLRLRTGQGPLFHLPRTAAGHRHRTRRGCVLSVAGSAGVPRSVRYARGKDERGRGAQGPGRAGALLRLDRDVQPQRLGHRGAVRDHALRCQHGAAEADTGHRQRVDAGRALHFDLRDHPELRFRRSEVHVRHRPDRHRLHPGCRLPAADQAGADGL
ncbi:MAG: hypothetical protein AVDCRST_MAG69-2204, partial [uncultured Solirubrobacteraceae bacterium]